MQRHLADSRPPHHHHWWLTALVLLALLLLVAPVAGATEVIPSIGLTRAVDGNQEVRTSYGVALRGDLLPVLKTELGVSYRSESRFNDAPELRQWPITASLWLAPVPALYAGAGVGLYHTTYDYDQDVLPVAIEDETKQEFGVHLGGGLRVPLAPQAAVDVQGRYVMMRDQESRLVPERFDPDFWTTQIGLALRF